MIDYARKYGDNLTNLKLQKLLYFAQAWYLAFNKECLFDDEIQAWVHGPVVPSVYFMFKDYKWNDITEDLPTVNFSSDVNEHLTNVFDYYGRYTAYELEKITHDADPWKNARGNLAPDVSSSRPIPVKDIQHYYESLQLELS